MKAVVGIDADRRYWTALHLLKSMGFQLDEVILAHVLEPTIPSSPLANVLESIRDMEAYAHRVGLNALRDATEVAEGMAPKVHREVLQGSPVNSLIELSERTHADLITIRSERKGRLGSFFLGSISRGLAIASPRSVLFAKGEINSSGPLRAVFATDHSPYSRAAFDEFLRLHPIGIGSVHVVSAVAMDDYMFWALNVEDFRNGTHPEKEIHAKFTSWNQPILDRLHQGGYQATASVPVSSVSEAISEAMADADLLVMGAQGHGFVERLLVGSNSLHQIVGEPHSVLLMRPRNTPLRT